jgi:hypothetical protein
MRKEYICTKCTYNGAVYSAPNFSLHNSRLLTTSLGQSPEHFENPDTTSLSDMLLPNTEMMRTEADARNFISLWHVLC